MPAVRAGNAAALNGRKRIAVKAGRTTSAVTGPGLDGTLLQTGAYWMERYGSAMSAVVAALRTTNATTRSDILNNISFTRLPGASRIKRSD